MKDNNVKITGFLGGLIFFIIGVVLLWWNEGRTVVQQSMILEAGQKLVQVNDAKVDSANEGKLVAIYGKIDEEKLSQLGDSEFGVVVKSPKLVRKVEMYQWEEECEEDTNDNETCTYSKVWSDDLIDASKFKESGYENPMSFKYDSKGIISEEVRVGEFLIPDELVEELSTEKTFDNLDQAAAEAHGFIIQNNYYTDVKDNKPQIGDTRISFVYNNAKNLSAIGVQTGDTLIRYTAKKGGILLSIREGNHTGAEMLAAMKKENNIIKWALRALGFFFVTSAISGLFSVINKLAEKVPVLGGIVSGVTGIISGLLGFAISLVVIAVAWFRFRPILSIVLLALVAAIVVIVRILKKNKSRT